MDTLYLLVTAAFFAATAMLVAGCDALRGQA